MDFDRLVKAAPVLGAFVYFVGFLVVTGNLGRHGVTSLEVFRLQYFVTGAWCLFPIIVLGSLIHVVQIFVSRLVREIEPDGERAVILRFGDWRKHRPLLFFSLLGALFILFALFVVLRGFGMLGFRELWPYLRANWFALLFMIFALLFCVYAIALARWLRKSTDDSAWAMGRVFLVCSGCVALAYIMLFSRVVYSSIPLRFGGGAPPLVVFVLPDATASTNSYFIRDGSGPKTIPYKLLLEKDHSLVIISPNDHEQAIEFDRKEIVAMIVLKNK